MAPPCTTPQSLKRLTIEPIPPLYGKTAQGCVQRRSVTLPNRSLSYSLLFANNILLQSLHHSVDKRSRNASLAATNGDHTSAAHHPSCSSHALSGAGLGSANSKRLGKKMICEKIVLPWFIWPVLPFACKLCGRCISQINLILYRLQQLSSISYLYTIS